MSDGVVVRRTELRYLLVSYVFEHGAATVQELVDALTVQGFDLGSRPSKLVSDALRCETQRGRVIRVGWGRYRSGSMPRSTEYRIDQRVDALRAKVAQTSRKGGQVA
jgi:hypothetical protein